MIRARLFCLTLIVAGAASPAFAQIRHVVQPGDTVTSITLHYYGDPVKEAIVRAVNQMPSEGEIDLAVGEPILIPERSHRIVRDGETWAAIARFELGTPDRAGLLAEANNGTEDSQPEAGSIIVVPYLMPLSMTDGLPATIVRFYPGAPMRRTAQMLRSVNPNLRGRVPRGTRIVLPMTDLVIIDARREQIRQAQDTRRSPEQLDQQRAAQADLAQLPPLLAAGSFAEVVVEASHISGCTELTAAQYVTIHRYLGQAFLALDRTDLAQQEFVQLLGLQPDFQFDQVTTSPTVLRLLDAARNDRDSGEGGG